MLKPTKILVPTDFSESSDRAVTQGSDIAQQYKARLFLLHVIHEDIYRAGLEFAFLEETARHEIRERAEDWARDSIRKQLGDLAQSRNVETVMRVRWGIPYNEILKEEKEQGIDLIVIASLGRSGIAEYFMGSVARNVLKGARCPVLLTK